jgi:hypothetical protein
MKQSPITIFALRFVFWHSIALACLVGLPVMVQAYLLPDMIVQ